MRWLAAWCTLTLVPACNIEIPSNTYSCSNDAECPQGWSCQAQLCRDRPARDAGSDSGTPLKAAAIAAHGGGGQGAGSQAGATAQAGSTVAHDSDRDAGDDWPSDAAIAQLAHACSQEGLLACTGHAVVTRLRCHASSWQANASCSEQARCDTTLGPGQGKCADVPTPCRDLQPGAAVCADQRRRVCDADLLHVAANDCPEHSHCLDDGAVHCDCDTGYMRDDTGLCRQLDPCAKSACGAGGRCLAAGADFSCECDAGYTGSGSKHCEDIDDCAGNPCGAGATGCTDAVASYTCSCADGYVGTGDKACTDIDECSQSNVCQNPDYPCRNSAPYYVCDGQLATWPMPDATPGATPTPSYTANDSTKTLFDNVTKLTWERDLPALYPDCTAKNDEDATSMPGARCKWSEAFAHCDQATVGGYTDWRLPSKIELESLLDLTSPTTAISPSFPTTEAAGYWTSSAYALDATRSKAYWYVHMGEGWSYFGSTMTEFYRVRCVR